MDRLFSLDECEEFANCKIMNLYSDFEKSICRQLADTMRESDRLQKAFKKLEDYGEDAAAMVEWALSNKDSGDAA